MLRDRYPRLRRLRADRRGVGIAEYALLLLIVIGGVALAYRFIGKSVKHAGSRTEQQFQSGGNDEKTAANANSAGGEGSKTASANSAGGGAGGSGAGGSGGAGGGAGASGGGKVATSDQGSSGAGGEEEDERGTPLWKIIAGVFVLLFAIGGYFAFRKQSKGG